MLELEANSTSAPVNLNTIELFDHDFRESLDAPIDTYIDKSNKLGTLIDPKDFNSLTANLVLLGLVSAVESYMREIIRKSILIDSRSLQKCENHPLTYGAAIVHNKGLMPDAILENITFAGKVNIKNALKDFLDIGGHLDSSLNTALDQFEKVCQLRHCLVHRFGKLGTKNAIALGLGEHMTCVEKPIKFSYHSLQNCQAVCLSAVKEINNHIFNKLLSRLIVDNNNKRRSDVIWKWKYNQDRKYFSKYYKLFVSSKASPSANDSIRKAYDNYKNYYRGLL